MIHTEAPHTGNTELGYIYSKSWLNYSLDCRVIGKPKPKVTWFRQGEPLQYTPDVKVGGQGNCWELHRSLRSPPNFVISYREMSGLTSTFLSFSSEGILRHGGNLPASYPKDRAGALRALLRRGKEQIWCRRYSHGTRSNR